MSVSVDSVEVTEDLDRAGMVRDSSVEDDELGMICCEGCVDNDVLVMMCW